MMRRYLIDAIEKRAKQRLLMERLMKNRRAAQAPLSDEIDKMIGQGMIKFKEYF